MIKLTKNEIEKIIESCNEFFIENIGTAGEIEAIGTIGDYTINISMAPGDEIDSDIYYPKNVRQITNEKGIIYAGETDFFKLI